MSSYFSFDFASGAPSPRVERKRKADEVDEEDKMDKVDQVDHEDSADLIEPDYKKIALLAINELHNSLYCEQLGLNPEEMREAFDYLFRNCVKNADGERVKVARTVETVIEPGRLTYLQYIVALDADPDLTYKQFCGMHGLAMDEEYAEE